MAKLGKTKGLLRALLEEAVEAEIALEEAKELNKGAKAKQARLDELQKDLDKVKSDIDKGKLKIEAQEKECKEVFDATMRDLEDMKSKLVEEAKEEKKKAQTAVKSANTRLKNIEASIAEKEDALSKIEKELSNKEAKLESLRKQARAL